jgi:hypothetical protein
LSKNWFKSPGKIPKLLKGNYFFPFVGSNFGLAPIPVMHWIIRSKLVRAVAVPINAAKADTLLFPPGVAPQQFDESDNCASVERRSIAFSLLKIQETLMFTPITPQKEDLKKPKASLGFSDCNHQFSSLR